MNKIPIDSNDFEKYIKENKIFERAKKIMAISLREWYYDYPEDFISYMFAPFDEVMKEYKFINKEVTISKNLFFYEPHDYYLSVSISIFDRQGSYILKYVVFLDFDFEVRDDSYSTEKILRASKNLEEYLDM
jgi:hypothetical protein